MDPLQRRFEIQWARYQAQLNALNKINLDKQPKVQKGEPAVCAKQTCDRKETQQNWATHRLLAPALIDDFIIGVIIVFLQQVPSVMAALVLCGLILSIYLHGKGIK